MPTVAEMLEEAMRRKNVSQQRLARETGITAPWINMILRQNKAAGPEALLRMAEALDIDKRKLVRQAHYERAYGEWKPFLQPEEEGPAPPTGMVPVIAGAPAVRDLVDREGAALRPSSSGRPEGTRTGEVERSPRENGADETADAPGAYSGSAGFVGFDPECRAIRIEGDGLEPVAYDGQYVVVSPKVPKEDMPDGAIVYVTYELPGETGARAMIRRMYRYRLAGDETDTPGLPVYNFVPVNTRLRMKGREAELEGAITLRHRSVREMYPVVGVIFGSR